MLTVTKVSLPRCYTEKGTPPAVMYPIARNGSKIPIVSPSVLRLLLMQPPPLFLGFHFAGVEAAAPAARVLEWGLGRGKGERQREAGGGSRVGQFGWVGRAGRREREGGRSGHGARGWWLPREADGHGCRFHAGMQGLVEPGVRSGSDDDNISFF
jgi:hypothetical protein